MNENLTPKQRRAVEALLTKGDITQAAIEAKVSRETIYRWMKNQAFRTAIQVGTQQALEGLSRSLLSLGDQAIMTFSDALNDSSASLTIRIRVADLVLGRLLQLCELVDLEERIRRLEEKNENKS